MDLKNNTITVRELLQNPAAKKLLIKEFPEVASPLLQQIGAQMTLDAVLGLVGGRYPRSKIDAVLRQLEAL